MLYCRLYVRLLNVYLFLLSWYMVWLFICLFLLSLSLFVNYPMGTLSLPDKNPSSVMNPEDLYKYCCCKDFKSKSIVRLYNIDNWIFDVPIELVSSSESVTTRNRKGLGNEKTKPYNTFFMCYASYCRKKREIYIWKF